MRRAVFLDKDGTLLRDVPYNVDPARMEFAPGARAGLARLAQLDCALAVVTNQCGVAERRFDEAALQTVARRLRQMFADCGAHLAAFVWCPHARPAPDAAPECGCRKPQPGMLLRIAAELRLDLSRSWMIGDILDDVEAGRRAGCRSILIDNGNETVWRAGRLRAPHARVRDFDHAALFVQRHWQAQARAEPMPERPG